MVEIYKSNILESESKNGKIKYWMCKAIQKGDSFYVVTEYWQGDGKHQVSEPYEIFGKNEGKKNATTAKEQAILTVDRKALQQLDSGYSDGTNKKEFVLPMLALKYQDRKHNIKYPCIAQPKLDGCRCLISNNTAWSRKGKYFIPEVVVHITKSLSKDIIYDGELMAPDITFQESMSLIKKYRKGESEKLVYYVYDIVDKNKTFEERYKMLLKLKDINQNIQIVDNITCNSEKDIFKAHKKFIKDGFEGTMIRNLSGKYLINHRSSDLLKLKDFIDEEFEIVGFKEGEGRNKGVITFICKLENGSTVDVNLEGTLESRKEMWENREKFIGKLLTVQYQGFTDKGSLRFPVGKGIRDYE